MLKITPQSTSITSLENTNQKSPPPAGEHSFISKVKQIIQANFSNKQFGVPTLARQTHLSVSQLNRRLNAIIHQPAGQLIWEMKMDYAAWLLLQGEYSIGQIGGQVGYEIQAHFCRSFKKRYRCTPSKFKQAYHRRAHARYR